ncbi:MAG: hypothetical protein ACR2G7_13545 [Acidimicrobiales bacterium]
MDRRRFILRYRGSGPKPAADVERVRSLRGVTVLDDSAARMLLIECDERPPTEVAETLTDWVVAPEQTFAVPDTRKRAR